MKASSVVSAYKKHQSQLFYIPIVLLILAILFLSVHFVQTGELFKKDISLRGGIVGTIELSNDDTVYETAKVTSDLNQEFEGISFEVSQITSRNNQVGIIIESTFESSAEREELLAFIESYFSVDITQVTLEQTESSFGDAFFRNLLGGVLLSFILMAAVVYATFRKWYPSALVVFAVFSDIVITLAFVTLLNVKISGAGIAAFLMIIGYAVDTNILLSYRVLRTHDKTPFERVIDASKTGLLMSGTTFAAMLAALLITNSVVIFQILLILTIALAVDMINTWLFNANLLQKYLIKYDTHGQSNMKKKKRGGRK